MPIFKSLQRTICIVSVIGGMFPLYGQLSLDGPAKAGCTLTGPDYMISSDCGSIEGANLFHSFSEFNVNMNESATFTFSGVGSITNILSRVTGGNPSNINGLIASTITGDNFFFMNPAGIVFGPQATLDIPGSVHFSTADYLRFSDGEQFFATPIAGEVLSVAAPSDFGFLGPNVASFAVNQSSLNWPDGEVFSIIGGEIITDNAVLQSAGGTLNLVAVAASGEVSVDTSQDAGNTTNVDAFSSFSDIDLNNNTVINLTGTGGGSLFVAGAEVTLSSSQAHLDTTGSMNGQDIVIMGGKLNLVDSLLRAISFGSGHAGDISVVADMEVFMTGSGAGIFADAADAGNAGAISISTGHLEIIDGAVIRSTTFGAGNSGDIMITTDSIMIARPVSSLGAGIFSQVLNATMGGEGGDIVINNTAIIEMKEDAKISTFNDGPNPGGDIVITSDDLSLTSGAIIEGAARANGTGGLIDLTIANQTIFDGFGNLNFSGIKSDTTNEGDAGSVTIRSGMLQILNGASIRTSTSGTGDAGAIVIDVSGGAIVINGGGFTAETGIFSDTSLNGNQSISVSDVNVTVNIDHTFIGDLEAILTSPGGSDVTLFSEIGGSGQQFTNTTLDDQAGTSINSGSAPFTGSFQPDGSLSDFDLQDPNGVWTLSIEDFFAGDDGTLNDWSLDINNTAFASTDTPLDINDNATAVSLIDVAFAVGAPIVAGNAGDITISSNTLTISGAQINAGTTGTGDSGMIRIDVTDLSLMDNAIIDSGTQLTSGGGGDGGDIEIIAGQDIKILSESVISASTSGDGDGGNISIQTGSLEIVDSQGVTAVSEQFGVGDAGDIRVTATSITIDVDETIVTSDGGIVSESNNFTGFSGDIVIDTFSLDILSDGLVSSVSRSVGDAGDITITADAISVIDNGKIISGGEFDLSAGGDISISTRLLEFHGDGGINSESQGDGDSGDVTITADEIVFRDTGHIESGTIAGVGGAVTINTRLLDMADDGKIDTSSFGPGFAGLISITADSITIDHAAIISITDFDGSGDGGDIIVAARTLTMSNGAVIDATTSSIGNGGFVDITVTELLDLDRANIKSSADDDAFGDAGVVTVRAQTLQMRGGAEIESTTSSEGNAGAIIIDVTGSIILSGGSDAVQTQIISETFATEGGDAGSISITARDLMLVDGAAISATSFGKGAGGDIDITVIDEVLLSGLHVTGDGVPNAGGLYVNAQGTEANTNDGGTVTLRSAELTMRDGSVIAGITLGPGNAGFIDVGVTDTIDLDNAAITSSSGGTGDAGIIILDAGKIIMDNFSEVVSDTRISGAGGGIMIHTGMLSILNGSDISARTSGRGNGGSIVIDVPGEILIDGGGAFDSTGIFTDTLRVAGITDVDITVNIDHTFVADLDAILISPEGTDITLFSEVGNNGQNFVNTTLDDQADTSIDEATAPFTGRFRPTDSLALFAGEDPNGLWTLQIEDLFSPDSGMLNNWSLDINGTMFTSSDTPLPINDLDIVISEIPVSLPLSEIGAAGNGGDITITADSLIVRSAQINADSDGSGDSGKIRIEANSIFVGSVDGPSAIVSDTKNKNKGGNGSTVEIIAERFEMDFGSRLSAGTLGDGNGGSVRVDVDQIFLANGSIIDTSTTLASRGGAGGNIDIVDNTRLEISSGAGIKATSGGDGRGGEITVNAGVIQIKNNAFISAGATGTGKAGNIVLNAKDSLRIKNGSISTEALHSEGGNITICSGNRINLSNGRITAQAQGDGGEIVLKAPFIIKFVDSRITAEAGNNGGNISIDPIHTILQNSQIIANAIQGSGGDIQIATQVFLVSPESIISASSKFGVAGNIKIFAPDIDIAGSLAVLSGSLLKVDQQLSERCTVRTDDTISSFIVVGRGGLPVEPNDYIPMFNAGTMGLGDE